MPDNTFKLTNENVRSRCVAPAPGEVTATGREVRQRIYWDAELKGFGCLVGARAKSFIMQRDVMGRSVRTTIGRFPTWTADQARKRARELAVGFDKGVDPNAAAREAAQQERAAEWKRFTLAQAIDEHAANMKATGCAERSINTAGLTPNEQYVIEHRFFTCPKVTLHEIGARIGCSKERVRQIEVAALAKLRATLAPTLGTDD